MSEETNTATSLTREKFQARTRIAKERGWKRLPSWGEQVARGDGEVYAVWPQGAESDHPAHRVPHFEEEVSEPQRFEVAFSWPGVPGRRFELDNLGNVSFKRQMELLFSELELNGVPEKIEIFNLTTGKDQRYETRR